MTMAPACYLSALVMEVTWRKMKVTLPTFELRAGVLCISWLIILIKLILLQREIASISIQNIYCHAGEKINFKISTPSSTPWFITTRHNYSLFYTSGVFMLIS